MARKMTVHRTAAESNPVEEKPLSEEEALSKEALERVMSRAKEAQLAALTQDAIKRVETRWRLYGKEGPPGNVSHVLRCPSCDHLVLFHNGEPFSAKGLGDKGCKKCGKKIPFADPSRQRFSPKAIFHIDKDIDNHLPTEGS
jgi:hypothetical protein